MLARDSRRRGLGCRVGPGACWASLGGGVSGGSSGRGGSDGGRAGIAGEGLEAAERTLAWGCWAGRGRKVGDVSQEHAPGGWPVGSYLLRS